VAVWQFTVALLPQSWLDAGGAIENLFGTEGFDPSASWAGYHVDALEASLSAVLPQGKSWHAELRLWGHVETDDIQLWSTGEMIESLQVRFDLRRPNISLFREVVRVAHKRALAIVSLATRRKLGLEVNQLLRAAAESDAAHFATDPESFLLQVGVANERAT
jgi:hypothetical protein